MAANLELAKQRGLDEYTVGLIDSIHDNLEGIILNLTLDSQIGELHDYFTEQEFKLQRVWGFSEDRRYHTWIHRLYKRRRELQYLGAVYRCKESGESRTIDKEALDGGALFGVGRGFIDFGDVVRVVGPLERIK